MKISNRLENISKLVIPGNGVIDVGADHGLVEKYLLENKISPYIVAVENKIGPFKILCSSLKDDKQVRCSLSDGIEDIDDKVQTIIIAGMGGINIVDIIKKNLTKLDNIEQIIVDPHRDTSLVRKEITSLGFKIDVEKIVIEGNKFYTIISFIRGNEKYSIDELEWGVKCISSKEFSLFKKQELDRLDKRLKSLEKSAKTSENDIKIIKNTIERLEKYGNK